jgi:hypothetical protein
LLQGRSYFLFLNFSGIKEGTTIVYSELALQKKDCPLIAKGFGTPADKYFVR